jgi:hypothetical protein
MWLLFQLECIHCVDCSWRWEEAIVKAIKYRSHRVKGMADSLLSRNSRVTLLEVSGFDPPPFDGLRAKRHSFPFKHDEVVKLDRYVAMVSQRLCTSAILASSTFSGVADTSVNVTRGTVAAEVGIGTIVTGCGRDSGLDLAYVNLCCLWMRKTLT